MNMQLSEFKLQELERMMNDFGTAPRIFNSEAQFQFELAWKIKEEFCCEVKLEELSRVNGGKKDYTDIILEKGDLRIALELKYKTAAISGYNLKKHGATDLGAYDFLWDVHRIQKLTKMEPSVKEEEVKLPCTRGYAVILTNDSHYWNDMTPKNTINREFLIGGNPSGELKKGEHKWFDKSGNRGNLPPAIANSPSRRDPIKICKDYVYQWKPYCDLKLTKNGVFKYMIVEIVPNCTMESNSEDID